MRPVIEPAALSIHPPQPDLHPVIARLVAFRSGWAALQRGDYEPLHVAISNWHLHGSLATKQ